MARYYEGESLRRAICRGCNEEFSDAPCEPSGCLLLREIQNLPTADVAPKSEVAIEVIDEAIRAVFLKTDMKIYNTIDGKPLGDCVAFGRQQAMYDVITLLSELKKKYTEGEND